MFVVFAVLIATCLVPTPTSRQSWAGRLFSRLKGPVIIIVICGIMLVLLLAVLVAVLPVDKGWIQSRYGITKNTMIRIKVAFMTYVMTYDGLLPPAKDQAGLLKNLTKDNPRGIVFLSLEAKDINSQGEALDAWGTPLHMTVVDSQHLDIRSAGPDKTWQTGDDLDASSIRQE